MLFGIKNKREQLTKNIKKEILEKYNFYKKFENDKDMANTVFLLGPSIIDQLGTDFKIKGKNVVNFGISGINSLEYNEYILNKNLIKNIGNKAFLMFGTNDIVVENWTKENILTEVKKIVKKLKEINKKCELYFWK